MIKGTEVRESVLRELLRKETVYFYNDYEDIVYKGYVEEGVDRYFAKKVGAKREEYEVFTKDSNCLMAAIMQPLIITKEDYDRA